MERLPVLCPGHASKIWPNAWFLPSAGEDLVLPDLQTQMLRQLASQVRHRMRVHETWGFSARGPPWLGL